VKSSALPEFWAALESLPPAAQKLRGKISNSGRKLLLTEKFKIQVRIDLQSVLDFVNRAIRVEI
jgi:hypothetical protein